LIVSLCVLLPSAGCKQAPPAQKPAPVPVIAVANYGAHPIIDVTVAAFKERLVALGYQDGKNVRIEWSSVEGNVNLAPQMVSGLLSKSPNVIVSITTPISQAVVKQARGRVPVVFCGVTDPIGAGLVPSWQNDLASGVTGTSDRWPYAEQLDLIKELLPKAKRIGVPYNSGESNSQYALEQIRSLAAARDLQIVTAVATSVGEVRAAIDSLITQRVDAIYAGSDNTVMAGFQSVLKVAHERKIPVIVGESANVERGGLATYSVDYRDLGRATADLVDKVLKGTAPGAIPVATFKGAQLYINPDAAKKMGVAVPPELLSRATIMHTKAE
jgi:putative ABC transport system substrate-binding protein